jgi:hypothetical protein
MKGIIMFEPIKISIPAEKLTEDVYIILEKGEVYYASKALKETYTVIMPTQEQQKTVTCYGTDGKVVTPFEGLYFRTVEEVTEKLDEINNRKVQAVFMVLVECLSSSASRARYYDDSRYVTRKVTMERLLSSITKGNFYHHLSQLIPENDIQRALYKVKYSKRLD